MRIDDNNNHPLSSNSTHYTYCLKIRRQSVPAGQQVFQRFYSTLAQGSRVESSAKLRRGVVDGGVR